MRLLAVDPGSDSGWAVHGDYGIEACGLGLCSRSLLSPGDAVVIEIPRDDDQQKAPLKDLLTLSIDIGRRIQYYSIWIDQRFYGVRPRSWKGCLAKATHHQAIQDDLRYNRPGDLAFVMARISLIAPSKQHNVWDAVGLAIWAWKRVGILGTVCDHKFTELK